MELQLDATITVLLISKISSTCFGQTFAHLQERKNLVASSCSSIFTLPTLMMHGQTQIKLNRGFVEFACSSILVILWIVRLNPFSYGDIVVDIGVWLVCIVEFRRPNSPSHVSSLVSVYYFSRYFQFSFDAQNFSFYS
jgi:hypothetical protein